MNTDIVPTFPEGHTCPSWCVRDHFEGFGEPLYSFDALCLGERNDHIWFVQNDSSQKPGVTGLSIEVEINVYTPAEARALAAQIVQAADEAEGWAA